MRSSGVDREGSEPRPSPPCLNGGDDARTRTTVAWVPQSQWRARVVSSTRKDCALSRRIVALVIQAALLVGLFTVASPVASAALRPHLPAPLTALLTVPRVAAGTPALPGFEEDLVFSGLANPTALAFAPDGRIFVAEKRGTIKVFDSLTDTSGALWADLRTQVHNYWDRGLLGMAIDPGFPSPARIYVSYTHDGVIGGPTPRWGTADTDTDPCPTPPGGTGNGCVVSGRVSALTQGAGSALATEQVLLEDWCQQYPSHSIGDLAVGPDGALYLGHGDGASFSFSDYGQQNAGVAADPNFPNNPCGDPPDGVGGSMTLPTAEGGSLRAQDLRTTGDPLTLNGSIVRIDRFSGAGPAGNPLIGSADLNARRMIAHGLRNPFRITFRPGTSELWVGDVGSSKADEVDRIVDTTPASVLNFGWPCREGLTTGPSTFQSADLCLTLGATEAPYFSYLRGDPVTDPDCTAGGTASIAGLAFAQGSSFPSSYNGALFIADYARDCIWAMPAGGNGLPDPAAIFKFADASNPVMLKIGPDGNLYYVDYGGAIRRIRVAGPQAVISADQTSGPLPLQVQFDGSGLERRARSDQLCLGPRRRRAVRRLDSSRAIVDLHLRWRGHGQPARHRWQRPDRYRGGRSASGQPAAGSGDRHAAGEPHLGRRRCDLVQRLRHRPRRGDPVCRPSPLDAGGAALSRRLP